MESPRATLELTIEGQGYGGEGYASPEPGRFVSVPHTLPGDIVEVEIGEYRRGRAFGEVRRWLARSGDHVEPCCEAYRWCSGCALRHVSEERERAFKLEEARAILRRYGPAGADAAPIRWLGLDGRDGHRVRGRFAVSVREGRVHIGLSSVGLSREVVDVRTCPAQSPTFLAALAPLADRLDQAPELAALVRRIEVRTTPEGQAAAVLDVEDLERVAAALEGVGLSLRLRRVDGDEEVDLALPMRLPRRAGEAIEVEVPWTSWTHATPAIADLLVTQVCDRLGPVGRVLDLCAGVGTLTTRLSGIATSVLAVDADHRGLRALASGLDAAGIHHVETRAGRLEAILRRLRAEGVAPFEAATINPMRRPLGAAVLGELPHLGVRRIIYLGPAPVSAARDAAALAEVGYGVDEVWVVNLHPSTAQFMLVVCSSVRDAPAMTP